MQPAYPHFAISSDEETQTFLPERSETNFINYGRDYFINPTFIQSVLQSGTNSVTVLQIRD